MKMRGRSLIERGATSVLTANTKAVWLIKPSRGLSQHYRQFAESGSLRLFWDILDSYKRTEYELAIPQCHQDVVLVATTPEVVANGGQPSSVLIPHHGDSRISRRQFDRKSKLSYWGQHTFLDGINLDKVFGVGIEAETGPKDGPTAGYVCIRRGREVDRHLKPQVKLANAVLADVPFVTEDVAAARSLAEYLDCPYEIRRSHGVADFLRGFEPGVSAPLLLVEQ